MIINISHNKTAQFWLLVKTVGLNHANFLLLCFGSYETLYRDISDEIDNEINEYSF